MNIDNDWMNYKFMQIMPGNISARYQALFVNSPTTANIPLRQFNRVLNGY